MALKKSKETIYGITANYWEIDNVYLDTKYNQGEIILGLYIDDKAKEPIDLYAVVFSEDTTTERFEKYFGKDITEYNNIYKACYMCIKETEEYFQDAVDC